MTSEDANRGVLLCVLTTEDMVGRMFFHGPGGSGKTYILTEVVLPVYKQYLPSCARGVAAQNSAARLIRGCTFHYLAGLTRNQALAIKKPSKSRVAALVRRWARLALLFIDEISLAPPPLLAVLNACAGWGRQEVARLKDVTDFQEHALGDILCQIMSGDFLQLNPVLNHIRSWRHGFELCVCVCVCMYIYIYIYIYTLHAGGFRCCHQSQSAV